MLNREELSVVSYQLSVISCQLSVVSCRLSVVGCRLSVASNVIKVDYQFFMFVQSSVYL